MYSCLFYHFLKFFQAFLWILNNFRSTDIFVKISTDVIFNISVRFKYQYTYIYWYFHPWVCIDFFFIFIGKWEIVLVMPRSGEKSTHNLSMHRYIRVWVKNNPIGQPNMHYGPHLNFLFKTTSFSFIIYLLF